MKENDYSKYVRFDHAAAQLPIESKSTTPPDFHEQARQLVEGWSEANNAWVHPLAINDLVERIASFAAEAATQGQVVGIECAAALLDDAVARKNVEVQELKAVNWSTLELQHYSEALRKAAIAIRALSPDPSYHNRVTELERELAELKEVNQGIIDGIADGKALIESQHQAELDRVRNEAATAALEQAARWQPIETAPKNGKVILGFCDPMLCSQGVVKAMYLPRKDIWVSPDGGEDYDLTHWMPLPQPPTINL